MYKYIIMNKFNRCIFFLQISLQMQQLLEQSLHSDSGSPVKIKFNWDASYWTKQISSFGTEILSLKQGSYMEN